MDVQLHLNFSQPGCTQPSQGLSNPFKNMSLGSQPGGTQDRPPVPMFAAAAGGGAPLVLQQPQDGSELPVSQLAADFLGTPDFVTPKDQFQLDYDPGNKEARQQRSPGRLSPNRGKRPRNDDGSQDACMDEGDDAAAARGGTAGPSGRALGPGGRYGAPQVRRVAPRPQSPPCYRSLFSDADGDAEDYAPWKAPRGGHMLSRYRQDFKELGLLGQGTFSKVFRARHRLDGREYAIKRSIREAGPDSPEFAQFIQEAQVLAHCPPHPNVVRYYTCWTEPQGGVEHLYAQLEKCDVSLGTHAALGEQLREAELVEVLRQMCQALQHLHAHGVAHLDVKPDNIYLQEREGGTQPMYKLGDFGQAARLGGGGGAGVGEGDSRYLPHEVMNGDLSALDRADMFSLGATLLELATRTELPANGPLYQDLRSGRLPLLPTMTTRFNAMVRALMAANASTRPSAAAILQSQLLAKKQSSPQGCQVLQHQSSTVSSETVVCGGGSEGAGGGSGSGAPPKFGSLMLRAVH